MPGRYAGTRRKVTAAPVRKSLSLSAVLPPGPTGDTKRLSGACCHGAASCKEIRGASSRERQQARGGRSADVAKVTFPERKKSLLFLSYNEFNRTWTVKDSGRERGIFQECLQTAFGDRARVKAGTHNNCTPCLHIPSSKLNLLVASILLHCSSNYLALNILFCCRSAGAWLVLLTQAPGAEEHLSIQAIP